MLANLFLSESTFDAGQLIDLAIMIFSLILFALAITAYRNTHVKKIAFAAAAFGSFAIQLGLEYIDELIHLLDEQLDTVLSLITLGILLLFFFAVVKK